MSRYAPYERLVAPARAKPQLWRLVFGLIAALALYLVGITLFIRIASWLLGAPLWATEITMVTGNTPTGTLLLLFSFVAMIAALGLMLPMMHKRGLFSLTGPAGAMIRDLARVFVAIVILQIVLSFVLAGGGGEGLVENPHLPASRWLALLPLSLAGVLIQVSAEELLFRGYLQSQLAARFRSPIVWMGLPSALFAIGHYDPVLMGENAVIVVIWAGLFGLLAADLTSRTGSLGAAIAFHLVNNAYALLLVGYPDQLGGIALYHLPFSASDLSFASPFILLDLFILVLTWLAARIALRR